MLLRQLLGVLWSLELAAAGSSKATSEALVVEGDARFTLLTDRLVRCEFAPGGAFVDESTYAVINRQLPVPKFTKSSEGGLTIETDAFVLKYTSGEPFSQSSLRLSYKDGRPWWHFGQNDAGNLFGTIRTLDDNAETVDLNCSNLHDPKDMRYNATEQHCAAGLLSKQGWAVLDDSGMPLWKDDQPMARKGTKDSVDIYLFLYGQDYKAALHDFMLIAGKPPLPPRYSLGVMFTRWFDFDDGLVREAVSEFQTRGLPLDTFIFDMNWHTHGPWGGYSWTKPEFPSVQGLLGWMRSKGLRMGANIHDADGVRASEDHYRDFEQAFGGCSGHDVKFQPANASYVRSVDDAVLAPLERCDEASCQGGAREGFNLWWIDYEQGERLGVADIPKLNPTAILNKARSEARGRRGEKERGLILSRWPGIGGHRYAVGFTGDQEHTWKGLAYLPGFTATAANIGFGFWSHDIYGGTITAPAGEEGLQRDWELRTRWIQFGAFSPVMRFHDKGEGTGACADGPGGCSRIWPWESPAANYAVERRFLVERTELLPYIYTMAWQAMTTGESLVRPLYHEFPNEPSAYDQANRQYFFGDNLVVSPVTAKGDMNGLTNWDMWVPPGNWWDVLDGRFLEGPRVVPLRLDISEMPMLARAGTALPRQLFDPTRPLGTAERPYDALRWDVSLAQGSSSSQVYEDDGHTEGRLSGEWLLTKMAYRSAETDRVSDDGMRDIILNITFEVTSGGKNYKGCPVTRDQLVRVPLALPPSQLSVSGGVRAELEPDPEGLGFVATLRDVPTQAGTKVTLAAQVPQVARLGQCGQGFLGASRRAQLAKKELDAANIDYSVPARGHLQAAAAAQAALRYKKPEDWAEVVARFWEDLFQATDEISALDLKAPQEHRKQRALALLAEAEHLPLSGCALKSSTWTSILT